MISTGLDSVNRSPLPPDSQAGLAGRAQLGLTRPEAQAMAVDSVSVVTVVSNVPVNARASATGLAPVE